jgi:thiamine kinase-like enzyme
MTADGSSSDPVVQAPELDEIAFLRGRRRTVEELSGGLTNVNLKVVCDDEHGHDEVVVRIAQPGADLLEIDRERERHDTEAAAEAGIGAPVVECPRNGLLVVRFLEGRTLTDDDLADLDTLRRVAASCRVLHAGPRFAGDFDMRAIMQRYLDVVQERGFRLPDRYLDHRDDAARVADALAVRMPPTVPCHNDLLAGNLIDDGEKIWIIDYEYGGNNDPCFELGNIWSEAGLPGGHLEELMTAYDGRHDPGRVARARLWGLLSKYGWTLWASIQDAVSTFDFDFWGWGMEKYERAEEEFGGPDFERLLAEAAGP